MQLLPWALLWIFHLICHKTSNLIQWLDSHNSTQYIRFEGNSAEDVSLAHLKKPAQANVTQTQQAKEGTFSMHHVTIIILLLFGVSIMVTLAIVLYQISANNLRVRLVKLT